METVKDKPLDESEKFTVEMFVKGCTTVCSNWNKNSMNTEPDRMEKMMYIYIQSALMKYTVK